MTPEKSTYPIRIRPEKELAPWLVPNWFRHQQYRPITSILHLSVVQTWMKQSGHQHFTSSICPVLHDTVLSFLQNIITKADALREYQQHTQIWLMDILRACEVEGIKIYGFDTDCCPIDNNIYHITELLTTSNVLKDTVNTELEESTTDQPQFYQQTKLEDNYANHVLNMGVEEYYQEPKEESICTKYTTSDSETTEVEDEQTTESKTSMDRREKMEQDVEDITAAQEKLDALITETEQDEGVMGESDHEIELVDPSEWEATTNTEGQTYYQLMTDMDEETLSQPNSMMSRQDFIELLGIASSDTNPGISYTNVAICALQQAMEDFLFKELSHGVLGWRISQNASEWRYFDALEKLEKMEETKSTTQEVEKYKIEVQMLKDQIQELNETIRATAKENQLPTLQIPTVPVSKSSEKGSLGSKLKRTFSAMGQRKKSKVTPM